MSPAPNLRVRTLWLVPLVALAGCGDGNPKTYPIPGRLVYQGGAPVPGATIVFQTTVEGKVIPARGMVQQDGRFELTTFKEGDGVVAGEHKVAVVSLPSPDGPKPVHPIIPPQYGDFDSSGLKSTVTPETQEIVITINRAGRK
jgi:hypothetical protein